MVGDIPAAITPVAPGLLICGMLLLATEPPLIIWPFPRHSCKHCLRGRQ
jgi:hypothetical protein